MKKVFLYAYDRINLGDDLFIHSIAKRYPEVQFYLWSNEENKRTFSSLANLKVIDQNSKWIRILSRIRKSLAARYKASIEKKCAAVIYIGGSLFIEYENWRQILTWWEYEAKNRPFYVLGANLGPYQSEEYRDKLDEIFANMQDVCFRDSYSYLKFEHNKKVRQADDILFALPIPKVDDIKKQVFVSVIDLGSKEEGINKLSECKKSYMTVMTNNIKRYIEQGYKVVLSSFCKHEGDEKAIQEILRSLNTYSDENIKVLNYDGTNTDEILTIIAESEFVVASRFHAVVLALAANRPVIPVIYSDKTVHVLEDIEFKGEYLDIRELKGDEQLSRPIGSQTGRSIQELNVSAQKHFEKVDMILKE